MKKFGKGIKFALSLHPLKRNEGRRDGGTASSRGGGVLAMLTTIFPGWDPLNGGQEKKFEKTSKRFGGNDKTPYICTRFRSWKATAMKMTRRVL